MYINVIWAVFCHLLQIFNIYSARYVCYRFWALAASIGTQPCKHCCQSMTLVHLTSKIQNSTYVHPGDGFFYFYTLHYNNFFLAACTVKTSILLLYNLDMRYRAYYQLNRLSHYWDLIISAHFNFWFRVKIHDPSRTTRELGARHYRVSW